MTDNLLADSFQRLLEENLTPDHVRKIEAGAPTTALWLEIEQSGFLDALVAEKEGGAGLGLSDVFPLALLCGRFAVPVPFFQTMLVRAAMAAIGQASPQGQIALATGKLMGDQTVLSNALAARDADWFLLAMENTIQLIPASNFEVKSGSGYEKLTARLSIKGSMSPETVLQTDVDWHAAGALLAAGLMAGAMDRVLEMSVMFAGDRMQFGRPLGKFQALQQLISVMAEQTFAAKMAANIGFSADNWKANPATAAIAKSRTSESAAIVAANSHALHGAIGATEEFDLQLYTRRLHEWRYAFGGETYWNQRIGRKLLASGNASVLDDIRAMVSH